MNSGNNPKKLILALPKGRILEEAIPILKRAGIEPEPSFFESSVFIIVVALAVELILSAAAVALRGSGSDNGDMISFSC